ncbi:MAG: hypothetical protein H0V79_05855 [Actinobacteria bacterium]|nr:hypothetical protein [Actinomycetota bacterium]
MPRHDLNELLSRAVQLGATDVHLKFAGPPAVRRDGQIVAIEGYNALTAENLESVVATVTAVNRQKETDFRATGELDIAYTSNDLTRYRVNGFLQRRAVSFAFRVIPKEVPSFESSECRPVSAACTSATTHAPTDRSSRATSSSATTSTPIHSRSS